MNSFYYYVFALVLITSLGISAEMSFNLIYAEIDDVPDRPVDLEADVVSSTQIDLSWDEPSDDNNDNNTAITGYNIEVREITDSSYETVVADIGSTSREYSHTGLDADTDYIYRVSAINSEGTGEPSREVRATTLSSNTDDDNDNASQQDSSIIDNVKKNSMDAFSNIVDKTKDPQHYVDRYNNEENYKKWFDENFPEITIYDALGIEKSDVEPTPEPTPEPTGLAPFVDKTKDPQHYVDRYNNEENYKKWFDENYPEYSSIYQAVGLTVPTETTIQDDDVDIKSKKCGLGTELIDNVCVVIKTQEKPWWQFW